MKMQQWTVFSLLSAKYTGYDIPFMGEQTEEERVSVMSKNIIDGLRYASSCKTMGKKKTTTPRRNMFDVCGQCRVSKKTSGRFFAPLTMTMTGPIWLVLLTKLANGGKSRYD